MHNVHQSFVVRERIRRSMGSVDNHVIWFQDARPEEDEEATSRLLMNVYRVMDEWVLSMQADADATAASTKPSEAVDACWDTSGQQIASGDGVWDGAVGLALTGEGAWTDKAPAEVGGVTVGDCAAYFPIHSTSRIVAGGPITNDVYKCHLKPVTAAIDNGDYGAWAPNDAQQERLETIFPDGVCDWSKRSVGYPGLSSTEQRATASAQSHGSAAPTDDGTDVGSLWWVLLGAAIGLALVGAAYAGARGDRS